MTYSIIQKSQIEGAHRIDAEYYQPEYLNLEKKLQIFESKKLSEVAQVTGGKRLPVNEIFSEGGVPYLRIVDIYSTFVDFSNIRFISEGLHKVLKQYQIQKKDILVTIVGTVGLVGYNQYDIYPFNFTENCARVRAKEVLPEFLLTVLSSRIGQLQVARERVGTAQPKLSLDRLRNFFIPIPKKSFQEEIRETIVRSQKLNEESESLYSQAENFLLEEIGLKDFKVEDDLFSIVNLSNVKSANRADAEYFQPKYDKLISKLKNKNAKLLGDLVSIKKGIEPGAEAYQEKGKLFIRVSSLSKDGITDKDQKYLNEELYKKLKNNYEPKVGEILLTKDATPGIAYLIKESIEGIISGGILRLKLKNNDIENEYLSLCLNSVIGQMQAERDGGGSIITHWKPEQIKNVLIPVLSKPTQQKIADLVQKSHNARKKAKGLLEEAKRKVENLVENSCKIKKQTDD